MSNEVKFITLFSELSKIGPISVVPTLRGKSVVFGFGDLNGTPWIDEDSVQCNAHILHVTNRGFFAAAQGGVVRDAYNPVRGIPTNATYGRRCLGRACTRASRPRTPAALELSPSPRGYRGWRRCRWSAADGSAPPPSPSRSAAPPSRRGRVAGAARRRRNRRRRPCSEVGSRSASGARTTA